MLKKDNISERKNSKTNEGIIDQSAKKTQIMTLTNLGADDVSILSFKKGTSTGVTPDKYFSEKKCSQM